MESTDGVLLPVDSLDRSFFNLFGEGYRRAEEKRPMNSRLLPNPIKYLLSKEIVYDHFLYKFSGISD